MGRVVFRPPAATRVTVASWIRLFPSADLGGPSAGETRRNAVSRPRRHVVLARAPRHRVPDLLLPARPRARHLARADLTRDVQLDHRQLQEPVSYTHLRAHETRHDLVCRLLLE